MYAALHSSEHYTVETKEFPLTYVRLLYFCFADRISVGENRRGAHRLYDHDQPAALIQHPYHAFDDCLRGEWEPRAAHLSLPITSSSSEPFSPLDISVSPSYTTTHIFPLTICYHCYHSAIPTTSARSILEEELAVSLYLLNILFTDRCPLILHPVNLILFKLFLLTLCNQHNKKLKLISKFFKSSTYFF